MNSFESPGLLRRLAALVYDTCLVLPIIMASVAAGTGIQMLTRAGLGSERVDAAVLDPNIVRLLSLLSVAIFYCWFWRLRGQTLGMQAWRIRLRNFDEESSNKGISLRQGLIRCAGSLVSAVPLGAGYWWCLFDSRGRYWHDYLSRTELELLPRTKERPQVIEASQ